ncbi:hypothetical protein [Dactylosporangium sp. CA-139066]|uniref:hypothetical protein n=1 Tax=Dactylosporangium sp. CA-139066 TaxID=3239930 RepID=UPI003D93D107
MPEPDHLLDWWRVRAAVPWATASTPVTGPIGGHRDGFLDYARTDELRRALGMAAAATELTFDACWCPAAPTTSRAHAT